VLPPVATGLAVLVVGGIAVPSTPVVCGITVSSPPVARGMMVSFPPVGGRAVLPVVGLTVLPVVELMVLLLVGGITILLLVGGITILLLVGGMTVLLVGGMTVFVGGMTVLPPIVGVVAVLPPEDVLPVDCGVPVSARGGVELVGATSPPPQPAIINGASNKA